ncbi:hypothetical protein DIPPA_28409 [Diplonema papillatum]|nr:hypothetical protein DIPPA_21937 [Diplonema papillatum]KAJ9456248.1 hypothetical protein DIPPA_24357 [Diplonema papillatum]KAJ9470574.1 hypothetical protein DIPPA_18517 [Diplonema papillatum]KAJ9470876.1 hypothetical protein DIPPA_12134 [Diplonema papillatum]KAJ9471600.1 hypothetical protein DIPPA_28409 [Diplonema papillatum]
MRRRRYRLLRKLFEAVLKAHPNKKSLLLQPGRKKMQKTAMRTVHRLHFSEMGTTSPRSTYRMMKMPKPPSLTSRPRSSFLPARIIMSPCLLLSSLKKTNLRRLLGKREKTRVDLERRPS